MKTRLESPDTRTRIEQTEFKFPESWTRGICADCGEKFKPKLPKQGICEPCRSFVYEIEPFRERKRPLATMDLEVFPGFMKLLLPDFEQYGTMAEAIGYSVRTIQHWNAIGKIKGSNGAVKKVCKYLGLTSDELLRKCCKLQELEHGL